MPQNLKILGRDDFSPSTFALEVYHPQLAIAARPGQFVIVIVSRGAERIPLTIADFDREKGTITLVIQAVGQSTKQMQDEMVVGASFLAVVGPMGIPSKIGHAKKVVCVGGGLGVAPLFPQLRAHKENGAYVMGVVGFRNENFLFWEKKFASYCDELIICTDDGSAGIKGLVTLGLEQSISKHDDIDEVVAIGPPIMMKAVAETTRPHAIKTVVSLNPIMVDGTGMCGGCRVRIGEETKFGCVDGPDFDGHQVDFDDLMTRLRRFAADEHLALERWQESCLAKGVTSGKENR
ncbi:sulfide/dihydroorotate dehydrogenase-like FAD/NAD-binding protein [bacterium]|nr:sulfide/dihydroorotate dehydrogenase-like FAD/NAD-binding protein [bacterium]